MSYYARGMRDLLRTTQLSLEFFDGLNEFQINFVDMCFKQSLDEHMGLMGDVETYNFHLFQEFKLMNFESSFIPDENYFKKAS